jgi:hypothetical protein
VVVTLDQLLSDTDNPVEWKAAVLSV